MCNLAIDRPHFTCTFPFMLSFVADVISSNMERPSICKNELITLLPKFILQKLISQRLKMHQVFSLTPLGPAWKGCRILIRIQCVDEIDVESLNGRTWNTGCDSISGQDI